MRPKFVIALLGLAMLVAGAALFLKQQTGPRRKTPVSAPEIAAAVRPAASNMVKRVPASAMSVSRPLPAPASSPALPPPPATLTPEERQAAVNAEIDHLHDWSMNKDPASLSNILAGLTYPDKMVRTVAIEAVKQFGSTDAIPALKDLAARDQDPEEKAALLNAANFLSLPSFTFGGPGTGPPTTPEQKQTGEQKRAAMEARRRALMQRQGRNQNSQSVPPATVQNSPTAPDNQ